MNAHIITIGDEIIIGQTLNTNAAFIGSELAKIEVNIVKTSVVGDIEEDILNEFSETFSKNDIVLVTGGLGPTHDDITRECVVKFFNTKLVLSEDVLEDITDLFAIREMEVTPVNEDQAMVPECSKVIRNSLGTAPGYWIEKDNKIFVAMPGVPFEMQRMISEFVIPNLVNRVKSDFVSRRLILQTTGIAESHLYEKLGSMKELLGDSKMAFLPSEFGVKLRLTAKGNTEGEALNKLSEIEQKIRGKIGRYIYSQVEENLENVVSRLLKDRGLTISLAESCTGGNISNLLTNISGSSEYYERGVISYSNGSKVEMLKVDEDILMQKGAVSSEIAMQMAEGIRSISGTDLGLSITGILGPTGATSEKPIGLVYVGICDDTICTAKKFNFGKDRIINKRKATQAALEVLRRHLLGINLDD